MGKRNWKIKYIWWNNSERNKITWAKGREEKIRLLKRNEGIKIDNNNRRLSLHQSFECIFEKKSERGPVMNCVRPKAIPFNIKEGVHDVSQ